MHSLIPEFILNQHLSGLKNGSFKAAALFMDVSGFTAITEQLMTYGKEGVETISDVLQFMFDEPVKAVYEHNGFVASFLGDALTGIFILDEQTDLKETILSAIGAALKIKDAFRTAFRSKFGEFKFDVKIGLSFGDCDWGILGQNKEKTYFFSGSVINNCATAENLAGDGEVWCDKLFLASANEFISVDKESSDNFYRLSRFEHELEITHNSLYKIKNFDEGLLAAFSGKHEVHFTNPELRDVSTVYLAFQNANLLDDLMSVVFDQITIWGGSHPHLYYGDKGWNLVVFFGAPIAHGNHPDRAINFLFSLKQKLPSDFQLKGGITSGKLYAGLNGAGIRREFTCLGSKVNLACRYMVLADWNEFLCDDQTAKNPNFLFENRGSISFKGTSKKITTYRIIKSNLEKNTVFNYNFIGREEEIKELFNAVMPVFQGKFGGVFYIDGSAGVGKTRLLHEFKDRLTRQNTIKNKKSNFTISKINQQEFYWLHLPCEEVRSRSFHPVIYFLKNYFGIFDNYTYQQNLKNFNKNFTAFFEQLPRGDLKELLNSRKSLLQSQLIKTGNSSQNNYLTGREFYDSFIYTVKALIKALSMLKPIIIHLEDGQWIDTETNRFLEILTKNTDNFPLVILVSCRYAENGMKIKLHPKQAVRGRLRLKPLSTKDSFSLTESIVRKDFKTSQQPAYSGKPLHIPIQTFSRIWDISEGNPFVIEQLVTYLSENNYLNKDLTLKIQQLELPSTINAVTTARIDKLSIPLKETIKAASVLGKEFDTRILSKLIEHKNRNLTELLQEGYNESIWHPVSETRYAFTHAILRDCAYQMQLNRHLKEFHLKTADLLINLHNSNLSDFLGEIAYHFEASDALLKAIHYYELAGDSCSNSFRNSEALVYYNKILNHLAAWREVKIDNWKIQQNDQGNVFLTELKDSLETYLRNLIKKADLMHLTGLWQETEEMYREIILISTKINQNNYLAKGYQYLGRFYQTAADFDKAMFYYKKARRQFLVNNDINGTLSILTNLGEICEKRNEIRKASRHYHYQLKLAEIHKNKKGLADAYWKLGNINFYNERFNAALVNYQKKLTISEEINDKNGIAIALNNMAMILNFQNNIETAYQYHQKQLQIAKEIGNIAEISRAYCHLARHLLNKARYEEAADLINKALIIDKELNIHANMMVSSSLKAEYLYKIKLNSEAFPIAQEALQHARVVGHADYISQCNTLLKLINFQLLPNRKAKIDYLNKINEEFNNETVVEMKIRDSLILLEMHSSVNYKSKTIYNNFIKFIKGSGLKLSARNTFIGEAEKLLRR